MAGVTGGGRTRHEAGGSVVVVVVTVTAAAGAVGGRPADEGGGGRVGWRRRSVGRAAEVLWPTPARRPRPAQAAGPRLDVHAGEEGGAMRGRGVVPSARECRGWEGGTRACEEKKKTKCRCGGRPVLARLKKHSLFFRRGRADGDAPTTREAAYFVCAWEAAGPPPLPTPAMHLGDTAGLVRAKRVGRVGGAARALELPRHSIRAPSPALALSPSPLARSPHPFSISLGRPHRPAFPPDHHLEAMAHAGAWGGGP